MSRPLAVSCITLLLRVGVSSASYQMRISIWLLVISVSASYLTCSHLSLISFSDYSERWRNYGLGFAYIGFNIAGTVLMYYMFRVKHYNPNSLVRGIRSGASFLCRVFKRHSGKTPMGKEAENGRLV